MEKFNLNTWLKDKSRKVVTRDGREVEIVKYDMKGTNFPILYVISNEDGSQEPCYCSKSGMCQFDNIQSSTDLFFADDENTELTEFEKVLKEVIEDVQNGDYIEEESFDFWKDRLLDLARKELEKENPYNERQNQKWSEEDKNMLLDIINDTEQGALLDKEQINWLKSLKDRVQSQPKQEWSEEDEKELKVIIDELKKYVMLNQYGTPLSACDISWLEELPSKFTIQPQPKQEWSKEDSERLLRIHQFIWANRKGDTDEIYQQEQDADWIMSLNPQQNNYDKGYNDGYSAAKYNQWKPKKEELEALRKRTYFCEGIDANLDSLYTNLLKL